MRLFDILFAGLAATAMVGCWVEPAPSRRYDPPPGTPATPAPSTPPPRISIDANKTLHASPGRGAGVFVSYSAGGTWTIAWTCDTYVNAGSTCPFDIAVGTHGLSELEATPSTVVAESDATSFRIRATTTTTLDSATFKVAAGGAIAISMRLRGQPYPSLLFYTSNGALATAPTDPIELVPSEP